jgi:hypothetical protein
LDERRPADIRALGLVLGLTFVLGVPTLALPYGRDQSIFALVGQVIAGGGFPYRDAFDFKPPGIHLLYAVAGAVSRGGMWGPRLLDLLSLLLGIVALFRLVRPATRRGAILAAIHWGVAYTLLVSYWDLAQPEACSSTLVLWSLFLFRDAGRGRRGPARAFGSGLLFGAAFWMKYTAVLYLPLHALVSAARAPVEVHAGEIVPAGATGRSRRLALAAGSLVALALVALYLLAGGAFAAFVESQRDYLPGYSRLVLAGDPWRNLAASASAGAGFFTERPFLLWLPLLGLALLVTSRGTALRWLPLTGVIASALAVIVQGKFFHYHWIPILPYLAWASGSGFDALLRRLEPRRGERRVVAGLLVVLAVSALALSRTFFFSERLPAVRFLAGATTREELVASAAFGSYGEGNYSVLGTMRAAERVAELCPEDGRIFVWGFEPLIYLASDRRPASRFIYNAPLISAWCPNGWRDEIVKTLTDDPPDLFVVVSHDPIPWVTGVPVDSEHALALYPDLLRLLAARYRPAGEVEHFRFFERIR